MLNRFLGIPAAFELAGRPYLIRPLSFGDMLMIQQSSAEGLGWMTGDGFYLVLWAAIRRDEPGFGIPQAVELAAAIRAEPDDHEAARAVIARVVSFVIATIWRERFAASALGGEGGTDEAWPEIAKALILGRGLTPGQVADLTLDQFVFYLCGGEPTAADPKLGLFGIEPESEETTDGEA